MLNLFHKKPRGNPTKTAIIKHDGKSKSTNQVRWNAPDMPIRRELTPQKAAFRGFASPPGRF